MRKRDPVHQQDPGLSTEMATVQVPVPILGALADVRDRFFALCVDAGCQVLTAMMEQDRTAACGPKWKPNPTRQARRGGSAPSEITLGGRRILIRRLRARSRAGTEVPLPSFHFAAAQDPLDARTLEAIGIGVSTRHYRRSLDWTAPGSVDG